MLHLNIKSLAKSKNRNHLKVLVSDIVVLSESRLKSSISDSEVALNGFNLFRIDRLDRSGGGVAIYVNSVFSVSILHTACTEML